MQVRTQVRRRNSKMSGASQKNRHNFSFINLEDLKFFCQEKGFSEEDFFRILSSVIKRVLEERIDQECEIEIVIEESKTIRVFNLKKMVIADEKYVKLDNVGTNISFIALSTAKRLFGEDIKIGQQVRDEIFLRNIPWLSNYFSEGVSNQIKQLHCARLKETYEKLVGETLLVTLITKTREGYLLKNVESPVDAKIFLSNYDVAKSKEPVLNEIFEVFVRAIEVSAQGSVRVIVSTVSDKLLREILHKEVPELRNGIIKIVATATSFQHNRSKVAVTTVGDTAIDPVGCFVGNNGSRMRSILTTLKGEKLSVFEWKENKSAYIAAALSPARVISVIAPKRKQSRFTVIVPDEHHPLAIGNNGSNVVLASSITNSNIDLMPLSEATKKRIKFNWNGNLTPEEVQSIKEGKKIIGASVGAEEEQQHGSGRSHRFRNPKQEQEGFERKKREWHQQKAQPKFARRHHQAGFEMNFGNIDMSLVDAELDRVRFDYGGGSSFEEMEKPSHIFERRVSYKNASEVEGEHKSAKENVLNVDSDILLGLKTDEREDIFDNIEEETEEKNWK